MTRHNPRHTRLVRAVLKQQRRETMEASERRPPPPPPEASHVSETKARVAREQAVTRLADKLTELAELGLTLAQEALENERAEQAEREARASRHRQ